ncbi:MAG: hypothetical protein KTR29_00570 [Rhodothermaceae bacterium]|nr:hypothetical protein [Rhodothermaceae bacterium]
MGKGALIGVIALSFLALITLRNTQSISRSTNDKQLEFQVGFMAKELAMKGRKLVLSSWIKNNGASARDIGTVNDGGGTITLLSDSVKSLIGTEIGFTVRGVYEGAVHDVTSRLRWGSILSSPLQMKVPDLNLTVSSTATLNMNEIALDTQSLDDLEQTLVIDLGLVPSLGSLNLGATDMRDAVEQELSDAGFLADEPAVVLIDQAMRNEFENSQDGIHYPDQVIQMINDYVNTHPGSQLSYSDDSSLPSTFGASTESVLRIKDNVELSGDLVGEGVLIIEGDFKVPTGITFDWTGLVVVAPPSGDLSGFIDLSGLVNINGSLVVAQDGVPNTGHMDLTINADLASSWLYPWGASGSANQPWAKHTHDFSGSYGTQVGFTSTTPGFIVHSNETQFDSFLGAFASNDELIFEFLNYTNHGLATVTMDITGIGLTASRVSAGFNDLIKSGNPYKSNPIRVGDINHLDISVNRLSSLKKLWDTGDDYQGCANVNDKTQGPDCVGGTYSNRFQSFALRVYKWNGVVEDHVYDASLYWHRRQDEEDDYEDDMNDLIADINAQNYGMDINIGDNTTITADNNAMNIIGGFTGTSSGNITNLGTWHRHWEPDDVDNPLYVVQTN